LIVLIGLSGFLGLRRTAGRYRGQQEKTKLAQNHTLGGEV
jgi:hypothetical protein